MMISKAVLLLFGMTLAGNLYASNARTGSNGDSREVAEVVVGVAVVLAAVRHFTKSNSDVTGFESETENSNFSYGFTPISDERDRGVQFKFEYRF